MKYQIRKGHRKTLPLLSRGTDVLTWKHYLQVPDTKWKRGSYDKILFLSQRLWVRVSSDTFSLSSPTWKAKELACRHCENIHQCSAQTISISFSVFVPAQKLFKLAQHQSSLHFLLLSTAEFASSFLNVVVQRKIWQEHLLFIHARATCFPSTGARKRLPTKHQHQKVNIKKNLK